MKTLFDYKDIENAFASGSISLQEFAGVLADNLGKKKARKVLRKNLDIKLKEEKMPFDLRYEYLSMVSLII